jgi:selenocysteine lyase/cysteine desulfurase
MAGRERMIETYREAKRQLAALVSRSVAEIALLGSASEGVNVVAQALEWQRGDNVVVADLEFPSLIYPFTRLQSRGVELRVVPNRNWLVELTDLRDAVDDRTRLVVVSQVSYLTGQRLSLPAVADIAWSVGAHLLVDATHALGVVPVDANYCDFLVSSCYKWLLAAHGIGVFVWNRARVPYLEPPSLGWHSVSHRAGRGGPTEVLLRPDADRFEIGNPSFPSVYLLANALERLNLQTPTTIERHAIALSGLVREALVERGFSVMTPSAPSDRAGNVCFEADEAEALVDALASRKVLVWGSEGRIRVSTHVYNSEDDVQRLVGSLVSIGP